MLGTCEQLAAGLGAGSGKKGKDGTPSSVGNAPLRLWVGQKFLGTFPLPSLPFVLIDAYTDPPQNYTSDSTKDPGRRSRLVRISTSPKSSSRSRRGRRRLCDGIGWPSPFFEPAFLFDQACICCFKHR